MGSLLPRMLLKERGIPPDKMSFGRTQSGKPYIASVRNYSCVDLVLTGDCGTM